jgi:dihydropteroate synthase
MRLHCVDRYLDLTYPQVMGILNITPESRYGGGITRLSPTLLKRAEQMIQEGATILDVGGESTRPGATPVSLQEELDRVMPVIEALKSYDVILSIDTRKPKVMQAAIAAGVHMINDVCALQIDDALSIIANSRVAVCLMHMQGEPQTMQDNPYYQDTVSEVKTFLASRVRACLLAGIEKERIAIDPGFGFGKTLEQNANLLRSLKVLVQLDTPILVGLSRKLMIEAALGLPVEERLPASLALAVLAIERGASIVRAHDVKATVEAIRITSYVIGGYNT